MLLRNTNISLQNYTALHPPPPKKSSIREIPPFKKWTFYCLSPHELAGITQSVRQVATGWKVGNRIQARRNFPGVKRPRREADNKLPSVPENKE